MTNLQICFRATTTEQTEVVLGLELTNGSFKVSNLNNNLTIISWNNEKDIGSVMVYTDSIVRLVDYEAIINKGADQ